MGQILKKCSTHITSYGLFVFIQVVFISSFIPLIPATPCDAEEGIIPVTVSAPERRTVYYTTGFVSAVSCADPAQGQRSELTVRTDTGRLDTLLVKATTTIYDAAGTAVTLDALHKQRVKVKYITSTEGVHEALSIKILK